MIRNHHMVSICKPMLAITAPGTARLCASYSSHLLLSYYMFHMLWYSPCHFVTPPLYKRSLFGCNCEISWCLSKIVSVANRCFSNISLVNLSFGRGKTWWLQTEIALLFNPLCRTNTHSCQNSTANCVSR